MPDTLQSQRCPHCGRVEAAGTYCTGCYCPTDERHYFVQELRGAAARRARGPAPARMHGAAQGAPR